MFGYVNPYRGELKVKENEIFKGYYCGLCKSLGRELNQFCRFSLNYDLNFLALLLSSLDSHKPTIKMETCIFNPIKKKKVIQNNKAIIYSSNISGILIWFKLVDNWRDEKSILSLIGLLPLIKPITKIKKRYRIKYEKIKDNLDALWEIETNKCSTIDKSAHAFGNIVEIIASPDFIKDDRTIRILKWLGYNLGRWIYILDAFDDIDLDVKKNNYNPILLQYNYNRGESIDDFIKRISERIEYSLTSTLDNIAKAFELLEIKHNKEILENIIYMGMRSKMERILYREGEKSCEKSI